MLAKQNDPSLKDKKVNIAPVDYVALKDKKVNIAPIDYVDKKYFKIEKKELILENDRLLEHIICQVVINVVMHVDVHFHNVLLVNNNSLEHDNLASELLKHENDRLMELLISQDFVHTVVNSLTVINDYKNMEKSFVDKNNETLELKAELAK
ncbi:hypothetical protein Tco_0279771, partial [Tanacetum coccineum]